MTWAEATLGESPDAEKIVGVLLAAGGGTRFAGSTHKLVAVLRDRLVVEWALAAATAALADGSLDELIVVTGAVAITLPATVLEVHNAEWADGQAGSLRRGIDAAADLAADAVVVGLGDQPFVPAESWRAVAGSRRPVAIATYGGRRGHPVRLHRSVWSMLPATGDEGARSLIALRPDLVDEVACSGSAADIDTMEDLHQWNSSTNSP